MKSKYRRTIIFGASGFLGKSLVEYHLHQQYTEVVTAVFRTSPKHFIDHPKLKIVILPSFSLFQLKKCIADHDLVVNAVGKLGSWQTKLDEYYQANTDFTKQLISAVNQSSAKLLVHLSSASVVGVIPQSSKPADESWPYNPQHSYEYSKSAAEIVLQEEAKKNWLILRPEFVYGKGDYHVFALFKAIKNNFFFLIDNGQSILHPTHIEDFIRGYDLAINSNQQNETYFIAGNKALTVNTLYENIKQVFRGIFTVSLPKEVVLFFAKGNEWLSKNMFFPNFLNRAQIDFFTQNRCFSTDKAKKELGYQPQISYSQGLIKTKKWYQQEGVL